MCDVKRCKACHFYKGSNGCNSGEGLKFCHHLLDTGKRRQVDEQTGECLSFTPLRKRKRGGDKPEFFTSP